MWRILARIWKKINGVLAIFASFILVYNISKGGRRICLSSMPEINLQDYRCENCNKLFFKGDIRHAVIEIKCRNCKQISRIECCGGNFDLPAGDKIADKNLKNKNI
jgi:hypothetical protein